MFSLFAALVALHAAAPAAASPARLTAIERDTLKTAIEKDRRDTEE